jgi:hypothetical protein
MTYYDRVELPPEDEFWDEDREIERKYPRQDAPGIFEVHFDTDLATHTNEWRFPKVPLRRANGADLDLFGTSRREPTTPKPIWTAMPAVLPSKMKVKQHVDGRAHSGGLGDETRKLYNAMSYKVLRDGWGFNAFITVTAKYLGLFSHAEFAEMIPEMNKAIAGWLQARPKRSARYFLTEPADHSYIFVLERSGYRHGLHFHMMCSIPVALRKEFHAYLRDWWENRACLAVPTNAVDVRYSDSGSRSKHYTNQAIKFRYLIKTVQQHAYAFDRDGERCWAVDFMMPWWPRFGRPDTLPIRTRQIYGISRDLNMKARREWGQKVGWNFVSKIDQRRLSEIYSGSEIPAWQARFVGEPGWWKQY